MASVYPGALDTLATNKADGTATLTDHKDHHNDLADAVNKIEAELGIEPSGAFSTVVARLNDGIYKSTLSAQGNTITAQDVAHIPLRIVGAVGQTEVLFDIWNRTGGGGTQKAFVVDKDANVAAVGAVVATEGGLGSSPELGLRASFDTTSGGSVVPGYYDMYLKSTMTAGAGSPAATLSVYNDADTVLMSISSAGRLSLPITGTNGGLVLGGDTQLYRNSGSQVIQTDTPFVIGTTGGAKTELQISSTTANTGLTIGGDTNLYRSAANVLQTDDELYLNAATPADQGTANSPYLRFRGRYDSSAGVGSFNDNPFDFRIRHVVGGSIATDITSELTIGVSVGASGETVLMSIDGESGQLRAPIAGSGGGLLIGGDTQLYRQAANVLGIPDKVRIEIAGGGKDEFQITSTTGDTGMTIGGDVNLYRLSANILATDDTFMLQTPTAVTDSSHPDSPSIILRGKYDSDAGAGVVSANYDMSIRNTVSYNGAAGSGSVDIINHPGTTVFAMSSAGQLSLPITGSAAGLVIGGDVQLYRSATNELTIPDRQIISISGGKTTLALTSTGTDVGMTIGGDTNLYRSAANTLKTDDAFIVDNNFTVTAALNLARWAHRNVSAATTLDASTDHYVGLLTSTAAAGFTVTLPTPTVGKSYKLFDVEANAHNKNVTIAIPSGHTLDGTTNGTIVLNVPRENVEVMYVDTSTWITV